MMSPFVFGTGYRYPSVLAQNIFCNFRTLMYVIELNCSITTMRSVVKISSTLRWLVTSTLSPARISLSAKAACMQATVLPVAAFGGEHRFVDDALVVRRRRAEEPEV